jgi:hypothetical protein
MTMTRLLAALLLVVATIGGALAADPPVLPKAKGTACIEDVATMRRDHMEMLKHQRDETLRHGIRGGKASLKDCVGCHAADGADGRPVAINAPGQFCQACHAYAAVSIDCFTCHATRPAKVATLDGGGR